MRKNCRAGLRVCISVTEELMADWVYIGKMKGVIEQIINDLVKSLLQLSEIVNWIVSK